MNYVLLNQGTAESKLAAIYLSRTVQPDDEIHSLFIDFALPNREAAIMAAEKIAEQYCTTHGVMNGQMIVDGIQITPVHFDMIANTYIPLSILDEESVKKLASPRLMQYPLYRHKAMLEGMCYARIVANATKVVEVHGGITQEQLDAFNDVFNSLRPPIQPTERIDIIMPFIGMELIDILDSLQLKISDVEDTVFCAEAIPCGTCPRCMKLEELKYAEENPD